MSDVWIAFGLTLFAGMATGIGSIMAFTAKRTNYRFLSITTGLSAGVMVYVSFVEIFPRGAQSLSSSYGQYTGNWINAASFFAGVLLMGLIDTLVPSSENPHEIRSETERRALLDPSTSVHGSETAKPLTGEFPHDRGMEHRELMRVGLFTALAIGIHNFPEGLATFLSALEDKNLGVAIALAVALHNIPEGISVSIPIFYATGQRKKAFFYSVLSGVAEPIGAAIGYLTIRFLFGGRTGVVPSEIIGIVFGAVAGIMVYISLDELLPTSRAYGKGHDSLYGLVAGMVVMALSLLLMQK